MKKVINILLVLLLSLSLYSQTDGVPQSQYHPWTVVNEGQFGSFWFMIERTDYTYNGYYWYYIYGYSNSYLQVNGTNYKATTFIDQPVITMWYNKRQTKYVYPMTSALFDWEKTKICWFYSTDPNAYFEYKFISVYPFDYSRVKK